VAKQTITIRLDEDDLTYLSSVELNGAANLSEKIRALLAEARAQRDGMHDSGLAWDFTRRLFAGPERGIREAELLAQMRSELIARVANWLPDVSALVLAGAPAPSASNRERAESLRKLERTLGERVLGFVDSILQMSLTGFPGCYEPEALSRRAQPALRALAMQATPTANEEVNPS
jgi:hypothetical protein